MLIWVCLAAITTVDAVSVAKLRAQLAANKKESRLILNTKKLLIVELKKLV